MLSRTVPPAIDPRHLSFLMGQCYTADEIQLRQILINARNQVGFGPELPAHAWYQENGILDEFSSSWKGYIMSCMTSSHPMTPESFHISPTDSRLTTVNEATLFERDISDRLFYRNQDVSELSLTNPMNFFLVDLKNMFHQLSMFNNRGIIDDYLQKIHQYLAYVHRQLPETYTVDAIYLSRLNDALDKFISYRAEISQHIGLTEKLQSLKANIHRIVNDAYKLLHFALQKHEVNPNAVIEYIQNEPRDNNDLQLHPVAQIYWSVDKLATAKKLLQGDEQIIKAYLNAIKQIQQLLDVENIITQLIDLSITYGEATASINMGEQFQQLKYDSLELNHQLQFNLYTIHTQNNLIRDMQQLAHWDRVQNDFVSPIKSPFLQNQAHLGYSGFSLLDLKSITAQIESSWPTMSSSHTIMPQSFSKIEQDLCRTIYEWRLGINPLSSIPPLLLIESGDLQQRPQISRFSFFSPHGIENPDLNLTLAHRSGVQLIPMMGLLLGVPILLLLMYLFYRRRTHKLSQEDASETNRLN